MRLSIPSSLILSIALLSIIGCSGPYSHTSDAVFPVNIQKDPANHIIAGQWLVEFDLDAIGKTIITDRTTMNHFNVRWMLPPPKIGINSYDPISEIIDIDVTLINPYTLNGFDTRLIIYTDEIGHLLVNPSNWTGLFDISGGLAINPFKAYSIEDPKRRFFNCSEQTENLLIKLPNGNNQVVFAVDVSFPDNCEEPYEITNVNIDQESIPTNQPVDVSCEVKSWLSNVQDVVLEIYEPDGQICLYNTILNNSIGDLFSGTIDLHNSIPNGTYQLRIKASTDDSQGVYLWYVKSVDVTKNPIQKRIIGYFVSWGVYARNYHVKDIHTSGSASKLTHINYAFANISSTTYLPVLGDWYADVDKFYDASMSVDGVSDKWIQGQLRGSFNQLYKLKQMYPELKVLISIGGWSWSYNFPHVASTSERREAFAEACIDMFIKGNFTDELVQPGIFDGIDIDWEYPTAQDTDNFTALLEELRKQLDEQESIDDKEYLLTIAAPAGEANYWNIDLTAIEPVLSFINVMTYDYHGGWDSVTNMHSPLYGDHEDPTYNYNFWTDYTIQDYLSYGIPSEKINMGVPFYGRGWKGVEPGPNIDGLYQQASGPADGLYESGVNDYDVLKDLTGTFDCYFHTEAQSFYMYDPVDGIFWTYDNPDSMMNKAQYVSGLDLGGIMFWELSGDDEMGTLIDIIYSNL